MHVRYIAQWVYKASVMSDLALFNPWRPEFIYETDIDLHFLSFPNHVMAHVDEVLRHGRPF